MFCNVKTKLFHMIIVVKILPVKHEKQSSLTSSQKQSIIEGNFLHSKRLETNYTK